ncbi:MAG: molybdate ABC transporter substrate-binding protein [Castellaniella sp.]|uniref:molybdate ABC transporter substrate-binding protein n=1 Tax=Castellaniella sp. TaxID=1955812 RepID=UPI002A35ACAC|nr:molybdate ABC transporter substrate-binding protein [Castellaniella sp.]MDY0309769.1 molybdate ABC transporter substrate-binding protein [Castellaniella sp.]
MKIRTWVAACALTFVALPAFAGEILVSAAASLTNAFKELATQYESAHPGTKVLTTFGASDVVLRQITEGAPADIFASADQKAMDKAVEAKAVDPATRVNFVRNEVVLVVPADNPRGIASLDDLKKSDVTRIALGNPASVPVGRYTQAALEKAGAWDAVKAREILGQNVRQVLSYVERGEVDAGFVFATDAAIMKDKVKVIQTVDTPTPVVYPIALVQRDGRAPEAADFLKFLMSDDGQAVLARYGFAKP